MPYDQPSHEEGLRQEALAAERVPELLACLQEAHPDACCALNHDNPLQLLVATILSAQCTDERVNQVTPALFARYKRAADFAAADRFELESLIRPTGFFRQKARYIIQSCYMIVQEHQGQVPADMTALLALPGVARKTANVVLGVGFDMAEGIVVDTHVKRLAHRLGLSSHSDPNRIEQDLMGLVPRSEWIDASHLLIFHGRRICAARKPACWDCPVRHLCPSASA